VQALTIGVMDGTGTVHPPGGASAIIAVIGSPKLQDLGFLYVVMVGLGVCMMLLVAIVGNNIHHKRQYPIWWF